ncbi:beta family protein [Aldersonia kunmingensis]|uniref:beta family protein n=1 Tax=Aldersonia kunmingensis TaxID=408066 RepID=UPI0008371CCE|nr:beta family protein [Aldersonia kunmingensis]
MRRSANHYIPILKARLGEFYALDHIRQEMAPNFTPLIEFVPTGDELDDDGEPISDRVTATVRKTAERLAKNWPEPTDVIIDLHALPSINGYYPVAEVIDQFFTEDRTQVIPTCRPGDATDDRLMDRLRLSLSNFETRATCIRLSDEDLDERDEPISTTLDRLLEKLDISADHVDLILDFGAVNETTASFAARIARLIILDLPHLDEWRSLTLAAGGFPSNLDDVSPETLTEVPRWELTTWRNVRDRLRGRSRVPTFGDYAVAYPGQLAPVPFAPAPQIRYTAAEGWLVLKGRKNNRRGNNQFLDICHAIAQHAEFTPELSWGDERIADNAQYANQDPAPQAAKPGNAMVWRAIGTSHHIAHVVNRLSTAGEP